MMKVCLVALMSLGMIGCESSRIPISGYYVPHLNEGNFFLPCNAEDSAFVVTGGDASLQAARNQAMLASPPSIYIEATGVPTAVPNWAQQLEPRGAYKVVQVRKTSTVEWPAACTHG